jgi:hypothetical protein
MQLHKRGLDADLSDRLHARSTGLEKAGPIVRMIATAGNIKGIRRGH